MSVSAEDLTQEKARHFSRHLMKKFAVGFVLLYTWSLPLHASVVASEAKEHVGENTTVCGQVASAHYAMRSRGSPTFIDLDKPYPNQVFTIVIWGSDRPNFGNPETAYDGKHICVTGRITLYRGAPETVVSGPSQIKTE